MLFSLLGRVAVGAQRPITIKLSRGRSVGLCVTDFFSYSYSYSYEDF